MSNWGDTIFEVNSESGLYSWKVGLSWGRVYGCNRYRAIDLLWVCKSSGLLNLEATVTMGWKPIAEPFAFTVWQRSICECSRCRVMNSVWVFKPSELDHLEIQVSTRWLIPCGTSTLAEYHTLRLLLLWVIRYPKRHVLCGFGSLQGSWTARLPPPHPLWLQDFMGSH